MSQLLKKFALLTAGAVLALCFTARPASAQMVEPDGTGEHLFFAYWSADEYTNTNVNIHAPLGVPGGVAPDNTVVYVRVRSTAPDRNTVASFNICLLPGDSWTATLSMEGLMVMDEGGCDGNLRELGSNPGNMNVSTPTMDGDPVSLGDTGSGYIEAWLNPVNTLKDDTVGEPDDDFSPENAMANLISGTAMLVSPMSGFASGYNATALTNCGNTTTTPSADTPSTTTIATAIAADATDDDGNGCWHVTVASAGGANTDDMGSPITIALGNQNMDLLTGRWTAISDDNVMSHTKVVLTFPQPHLGLADGTSDPVSVHVYDDMGNMALHSSGTDLTMGVNMCMFMPMDDMDMMGMLSCNDVEVGSLDGAMSGSFRIFNNTVANATTDRVREIPGLNVNAADSGGALQPAETLNAIGLIFSYFMGTDGMEYDQVTSIQPIDVDTDGTGTDTGAPL